MNFYEYLENRAKDNGVEKIVVGAVIMNDNGEILLMRRKEDDFMGGIFEIPGGNAEKGEGIYEVLAREIKEETNLDFKKVMTYINYFDYLSGSGKKCRQFNFKVEVKDGPIVLTEHDTYKWVGLDEIEAQNISDEVKECLIIYRFNEE